MQVHDPKLRQALEHMSVGRFAEAKALLLPLAARKPQDFDLSGFLAECHAHLGEFVQAEHHARRGTKLRPADPSPWIFLAKVLIAAGDKPGVEAAARRATELSPGDPEAIRLLAWILLETDKYADARELTARAVALFPADADLRLKQGNALRGLGRSAESHARLSGSVRACPTDTTLAISWASGANYVRGLSPREIREAHEHAGRLIEAQAGAAQVARPATAAIGGRRPRVGIISPDLRTHSVAYFVRPILEHHDREQVDLFVYSTTRGPDRVTQQFRELMPGRWRDFANAAPGAIAEAIRADGIDLLIETAGHTKDHVLDVMALRPAPVQATHIGYPATLGMKSVDYRLVDSLTDPTDEPREAEAACVEKLIRLDPCFTCYSPPEFTPEVQARTPAADGDVVFGCFNMLAKLNDDLFGLWGRILTELPRAKLLLKCRGLEHAQVREDVLERLKAAGVPSARTEILGFIAEPGGHLAAYHRVDIALDTSPYCGTTTTCEALYMGVPVVSLAAGGEWHPRVHAGRVGLSLLNAVGVGELVGQTPGEYVEKAVELGRDTERLKGYRMSLRGRLQGSVLCDGKAFATRWTASVREMLGI